MTDQSVRVQQHPALQTLKFLQAPLEQATARADGDPALTSPIAQVAAVRGYAQEVLDGAPPALVTDTILSALHSQFLNLANHLTNFSNGGGTGYLNNANAEADAILTVLAKLPGPTSENARAKSQAIKEYHRIVDQSADIAQQKFTALQSRSEQVAASMTNLEQRVANTDARIDSVITQYQQTFETSQAQRQQTFDNLQEQRQQKFDSLLDKRQQVLDTDILNHRAAVTAETASLKDAATAIIDSTSSQVKDGLAALDAAIGKTKDDARTTVAQLDADFRKTADSLVAALEDNRREADKLVGLIGERGVTSSYQKTANEARVEMWVWQSLTVIVMGVLLGGAIFEFVPALKAGWNWGIGGARMMVAITAILLAGYTGTQAKIARDTVRKNRRREMDLSALGPYLASLPVEEQHAIRMRIADRYFAENESEPKVAAAGLESLLDDPEVVNAMKSLPKAAVLAALKASK